MADQTPLSTEQDHTQGCEDWRSAAPGQRPCVCHVAEDVPDDY